MLRRVKRWMNLTRSDRALLARACVTVLLMRVALWLVPFRLLLRRARVRDGTGIYPKRLVWAVNTSSNYVPKVTCLVRSLAAQVLFARYGYGAEVRIGVAKPDGQFAAHPWLEYEAAVAICAAPREHTPMLIHASKIEHFG